jgi:two-component system NtrC family sensor kinase
LDSAYKYLEQCRQEDLKQTDHWSVPYLYLGQVYEKKGDPGRAIKYYKMGAGYSGQKLDTAQGYNYLASAFKMKGETDSAVFYASKAITISLKSSLSETLIEASRTLTDLYRAKHLPDSALKYQDIMLAAKDSAFSKEKIKQMENFAFDEQMRQQAIIEKQAQYRNSVKMYSLVAVVGVFLVLAIILWRNNRHKQQANEQIQKTLAELKATQTQLIQSEKMASLGELTAGIAHEIQNPLNFVNNFSDVSRELMEELNEELDKGDTKEAKAISMDVIENLGKITHHGKRADAIVKGMLQHSQSGGGAKEPTDINVLADEYLRLSYHGLRSKDKSFNAELMTNFDEKLPKVNVIPQDMGRVLLNLFNNAFYAVNQKQKTVGADYKPEVLVSISTKNGQVVIKVKDNGTGIPDAIKEKIMQPFFTTKPTGEGTGLGLSLTYDMVVKGHGGSIEVNTKEGEFTEFIIRLPV